MKKATNKKKKKKSTRHLGKLIFLVGIIIAIVAFIVLSNIISIKAIEISIETSNSNDNKVLTNEEIKNLSGLVEGNNLFQKKKNDIIESIKSNSYVENVEISRGLNGIVKINVKERAISYLINYAGAYIYIDNQGFILELNPEIKNVPILLGTSTDFTSLAVGDSANKVTRLNDKDLEKLSVVNDIMDKCKSNEVSGLVSKIDITNPKDYVLSLDSEAKTVYLGDCSDLNTRVLYMKKIVQEEAGRAGQIFINMDLNKEYVYFRENAG